MLLAELGLMTAFLLAGAALARWWTLLVPVAVWPLYLLGRDQEWWGERLREHWEKTLVLGTILGVAAAAVGVAAARLVASARRKRAPGPRSRP